MKELDFDKYYEAGEPEKRERAFARATAIGLQDVDGLKPSKYLLETAQRNIEGEITADEARQIIDEYYETKLGHDVPEDAKEADKVSARIVAIVNAPGFRLSPEYYLGLHKQIFDGVFSHKGLSEDAFVEHFASFISGIWQIHPFREGNTRTVALFAIKYLQSMKYDVTNDLFAVKSWYFRNALVRANYTNRKLDVEKTLLPLEEFFKVLIYRLEIELKNRFLKIGAEHGTRQGDSIKDLHRRDDDIKMTDDVANDVVNGVVKLTAAEEKAVMLILHDSHISAARLAAALGLKPRQGQRIIAALKTKANLKRRGADKNGKWYFATGKESLTVGGGKE